MRQKITRWLDRQSLRISYFGKRYLDDFVEGILALTEEEFWLYRLIGAVTIVLVIFPIMSMVHFPIWWSIHRQLGTPARPSRFVSQYCQLDWSENGF